MNNKKILYIAIAAIVVIVAVVLSVVFLGGNNTNNGGNQTVELPYKNATELLTIVWDKAPFIIDDSGTPDDTEDDLTKYIEYEGEMYYSWVGGIEVNGDDISKVDGFPANYELDGNLMDMHLGFPQNDLSSVVDAASFEFSMNPTTLMMAAFHLADGVNVDEMASKIENNLSHKEWSCGIPDRYVIITLPGNYIITIYGRSLATTFKNFVLSAVEGAEVYCDNLID